MQSIIRPTNILLPKKADLTKWSVVACDQYTSQPEYWQELEKEVADAPSALHLILPECFLGKNDEVRIAAIHEAMRAYLAGDVFTEYPDCTVYVERTMPSGAVRKGLVAAVDLEEYSYMKDAASAIRATEGTVLDRIPPRLRVRRGAAVELPHVMLLIDDETDSVMQAARSSAEENALYDFPLNQNGGRLKGRLVRSNTEVLSALDKLLTPDALVQKYGNCEPLIALVGDGNHSLATAKAYWEEIKPTLSEEQKSAHPARFALVEIVNLYDPALVIEPIHRVVFGLDAKAVTEALSSLGGEGCLQVITAEGETTVSAPQYAPECYYAVQQVLDSLVTENGASIDYVHGADAVRALSGKGACGILMPALQKSDLFPYVLTQGVLPRKTFSMGEAWEKRYYTEARNILP